MADEEQYPTPLPSNPFLAESAFSTAYQRCLVLEAAAPDLRAVPHCPPPLVCARLIGHLLRLAPKGNVQGQIQEDIKKAKNDNDLMKLAAFYVNGFIRTCNPNPSLL